MIETPRVPSPATPAAPLRPGRQGFRPQVKVFRGAPPTELTPDEKPAPAPLRLWLPVVSAERKRALLELHREVAAAWTQALRPGLRHSDQVKLAGFTFESADQLATTQAEGAAAILFAVEGSRMAGCLLLNAPLMAYLARSGMALDASAAKGAAAAHLTPLEAMIARRVIDRLIGQLGESYARAGIAQLRRRGLGEDLKGTPLFGPQDYLAAFRYAIGDPALSLGLTIGVNLELIDAVRINPAAIRETAGSARVGRLAAAVPVEAAIVLGGWSVPLLELASLAPGDEIILPEGNDAWLQVQGIAVRRLDIEVAGATIQARVRAADGPR